jgi:hypothetical protein
MQVVLPIENWRQAPLAHNHNPNYSGDRDQEDGGSKPAWANSSCEPASKNNQHKKVLAEWLKKYSTHLASFRPWVQTPVPPKKEKRKKENWERDIIRNNVVPDISWGWIMNKIS